MAEVKWQKRAEKELLKYLIDGFQQFGETTANKFMARVRFINEELGKYPESGFLEPLLKERKKLYRAYIINQRFKLIYYYAHKSDTIHIVDIWDIRRLPSSLAKRIK